MLLMDSSAVLFTRARNIFSSSLTIALEREHIPNRQGKKGLIARSTPWPAHPRGTRMRTSRAPLHKTIYLAGESYNLRFAGSSDFSKLRAPRLSTLLLAEKMVFVKFSLLLAVCLALSYVLPAQQCPVSGTRRGTYGIDLSSPFTRRNFECLKSRGYKFAIIRGYRSIGEQ